MYEACHDKPSYRRMVVSKYLVFYKVDDATRRVETLPLLHSSFVLVYTDTFFSAILYQSMDIVINPRGNGACPLCEQNGVCRIQGTLFKAMEGFSAQDDPMEVVVYSCPQFQEKL
jgi:hypothetical protein